MVLLDENSIYDKESMEVKTKYAFLLIRMLLHYVVHHLLPPQA